jgi:ATP/maltotriose-dependent transcriptional regulator MalT
MGTVRRPVVSPNSQATDSSLTSLQSLQRGREAFERKAWAEAHTQLSAADREAALAPDDLERLAVATELLARGSEFVDPLTRAHQGWLAAGNPQRAARAAFWLGFALMNKGDRAQAGGWLARAERLLDEANLDCVERGYLLLPVARRKMMEGNAAGAHDAFAAAAATGVRFADRDLIAIARHGMGRAVLMQGSVQRGIALLDEAMVAVVAGDVSPMLAGIIYCSVLDACHQVFDLARSREWTAALSLWCASQPDMVPFQGHCQIRRAELLQLKGDWSAALDEVKRVEARAETGPWSPTGEALYRVAELDRLSGRLEDADAGYAHATERGRSPNPGLALLRLAQGRVEAAAAAIRRATSEARDPREQADLLSASVEILLAARDAPGARAAADRLAELAARLDAPAPLLRALATQATGAVLLAEGDPAAALVELRRALSLWNELEAPYDGARTSVLVAEACRALGDADGAALELAAARRLFERLGAEYDLALLRRLEAKPASRRHDVLTAREVQVLRLVASGRTNRAIAGHLGISEKTVARHVANIFTKLGLSTRAAATAYAYEAGLTTPAT